MGYKKTRSDFTAGPGKNTIKNNFMATMLQIIYVKITNLLIWYHKGVLYAVYLIQITTKSI